jgi:hypothetical protein
VITSISEEALGLLDRMVRFCNPADLQRIAEDPKTDADVLTSLSRSEQIEVRASVADNANAPRSALLNLVFDPSVDVRFRMAENHGIPGDLLRILTTDENPYVSCRAIKTLDRLGTLFGDT